MPDKSDPRGLADQGFARGQEKGCAQFLPLLPNEDDRLAGTMTDDTIRGEAGTTACSAAPATTC